MVQDSNERKVVEDGEVVVKSQPEERQAAEVRPMRYVLGIGLLLVIIGMAVSYMTSLAGWHPDVVDQPRRRRCAQRPAGGSALRRSDAMGASVSACRASR